MGRLILIEQLLNQKTVDPDIHVLNIPNYHIFTVFVNGKSPGQEILN